MPALTPLTQEELEDEAGKWLGKLLFVFGRIETNLALFLGGLPADEAFEHVMAGLEKRNFGEKLADMLEAVGHRYADDIEIYAQWAEWYMAADCLRVLRNRLAHGRWGIIPNRQIVVHVVGLPGSPSQTEVPYSLLSLESEMAEANQLAAEFSRLARRWTRGPETRPPYS